MEIIKIAEADIKEIAARLKDGVTIVYPTETCYGLGCDATNPEAVERIFAIKERREDKPLLVVVPDLASILEYVEWNPLLGRLADKYWPGPLTVVVPVKAGTKLPPGVVGSDHTIAFRVTSHPLAEAISRELGSPLVSTSANISGGVNPYDSAAVTGAFADKPTSPDILIDAGMLPQQLPSTIVKLDGDAVKVIRQGELVINEATEL